MKLSLLTVAFAMSMFARQVVAGSEEDVRAQLDRFIAAQNAHDLNALSELLLDSPAFLWITRGMPVWGREAALKRFEVLYQGTWKLEARQDELKVTMLHADVAQIFLPIVFTIGAPNQPAQMTRFLMNQTIVKTPNGWTTASIIPIPAPQ